MKRFITACAFLCALAAHAFAACPAGYTEVDGPLPVQDGTGFSGRIVVFLPYSVLPLAVESQMTITVTNGALIAPNNGGLVCLAPANYTVTYMPTGSTLKFPRTWTVTSSTPTTVAAIEGSGTVTPQTSIGPSQITPGSNGQCLTTTGSTSVWGSCGVSVSGPPLTLTNGALGINQANASQPGYLSSADWTNFNAKQYSIPSSAGQLIGNVGGTVQGLPGITTPDGNNLVANSYSTGAAGVTLSNFSPSSFQLMTNNANSNTFLQILPNGTSSNSVVALRNASDQNNFGSLFAQAFSGHAAFNVGQTGTPVSPITDLTIGGTTAATSFSSINFEFLGVTQASISNTGLITGNGGLSNGASGVTLGTMSNAALAIQSNTLNNASVITVLPSGTASQSIFGIRNSSDTSNYANLRMNVNAGTASLQTSIAGTPASPITALNIGEATGSSNLASINFQFNGTTQASISNTGLITGTALSTGQQSITSTSTGLYVQATTANANTSILAMPNGTGTSFFVGGYNGSDRTNAALFRMSLISGAAGLLISTAGTGVIPPVLNIGSNNTDITNALTAVDFWFNGVTQASIGNTGNISTNGSLTLNAAGTTPFITSVSSSTAALQFQSGVVNQSSNAFMIPNGTGTGSLMGVRNSSDSLNYEALRIRASAATSYLDLFSVGTPANPITTLDIGETTTGLANLTAMNFMFNNVTRASLSNAGKWVPVSEQITGLSTGIGHYDATGNLTSSPVTSGDVNNTVAITGGDISTSSQVVSTHLTSALPTNQGGTGEAGMFTGIRKANSASADTAAASADVVGLFSGGSGCTGTNLLAANGTCQTGGGGATITQGIWAPYGVYNGGGTFQLPQSGTIYALLVTPTAPFAASKLEIRLVTSGTSYGAWAVYSAAGNLLASQTAGLANCGGCTQLYSLGSAYTLQPGSSYYIAFSSSSTTTGDYMYNIAAGDRIDPNTGTWSVSPINGQATNKVTWSTGTATWPSTLGALSTLGNMMFAILGN